MRILKVPAIISVLMVLAFSSCQKELDIDLADPPPPAGSMNDSIYLSKYVELDTTLPPGQDTSFIERYFYDNRKRITNSTYVEIVGSSLSQGDMTFYYNGSDTLPFKLTAVTYDNVNVPAIMDTVFFAYASNGLISKDSGWTYLASTNSRTSASVTKFSGSGNNVTVTNYWTDYNTPPPISDTTRGVAILVYSGEEIVQQTSPGNLLGYEYFQLGYADHPDPFYRIDHHYPVYNAYVGYGYGSAKKLLISQDVGTSQPNTIWAKYRWSYEYRGDGYPVVSRETDLLDPAHHYKYLYFYTHL